MLESSACRAEPKAGLRNFGNLLVFPRKEKRECLQVEILKGYFWGSFPFRSPRTPQIIPTSITNTSRMTRAVIPVVSAM
jgi:hypothetical protein